MSTWNYPLKGYWEVDPPTEFDVKGAAKAGEIGCFNCAHRRAVAKSGEVVCDYDGINLEEPDGIPWQYIAECWECE